MSDPPEGSGLSIIGPAPPFFRQPTMILKRRRKNIMKFFNCICVLFFSVLILACTGDTETVRMIECQNGDIVEQGEECPAEEEEEEEEETEPRPSRIAFAIS